MRFLLFVYVLISLKLLGIVLFEYDFLDLIFRDVFKYRFDYNKKKEIFCFRVFRIKIIGGCVFICNRVS